MDKQLLLMILNIIVVLPFILFLIYLSLKYGGGKLQSLQNGRFVKVIERVPITKESSILVVKIGEKAYVMSAGNNKTEILMELEEDEIQKIESMNKLPQYSRANIDDSVKKILDKLKLKKEDRNE